MEPLTKTQIAHAATNSPELSTHSFKLGDREFHVVFLPFDDYIEFLTYLEPLLTSLAGSAIDGFNPLALAQAILQYCKQSLPQMVCLMCKQTDPTMTPETVKELARNPFTLARAVLVQVQHDKMVEELGSFFEQIVGLMKTVKPTI